MVGQPGSTDRDRALIEAHLQELLAMPEFSRAQVQARALAAMVEGLLQGRELGGSDIARAVYGRADDAYVRAIRQVKRELRFKLLRHYASGPPGPVRIELIEDHYSAVARLASAARGNSGGPSRPADTTVAADTAEPAVAGHGPHPTDEPTASGGSEREVPTSPGAPPIARARARPGRRGAALHSGTARIVLGAGLLLTVAVAGTWALRPRSLVESALPATIAEADRRLVVQDRDGLVLEQWTARLLAITEFAATRPPGISPIELWASISAAPVVGDRPGLVALAACDHVRPDACRLFIVEASSGDALSSLAVPVLNPPGGRPASLHAPTDGAMDFIFKVQKMMAAELDGDGKGDELVLNLRHMCLFPSQIVVLEPGPPPRVIADFWSMGNVELKVLPDLDGDGADEIVALGERNADQAAFAWILPPIPASRGLSARTPDGRRPTMLDEVRHLPVAGITLVFPTSPLARPEFTDLWTMRGTARDVTFDGSNRVLTFHVFDAIHGPHGGGRMDFTVDLSTLTVGVRFVDYDLYLRELMRHLAPGGPIEDRWRIRDSESLASLGQDLGKSIRMATADGGSVTWGPIDPAVLARRLSRRE